MLSRELEHRLGEAAEHAKKNMHEFVTLEHMLLGLTNSPHIVEILQASSLNVQDLKKKLRDYISHNTPRVTPDQVQAMGGPEQWAPEFTLACHRVLQRAAFQVQSAGRKEVTEANVLVAMFHENNAQAVYLLVSQGLTQFDVVQYISHGDSTQSPSGVESQNDIDGREKDASKKSALESFCTNLNDKVIKGKSDPVIGRDDVIDRAIQILSRRTKNNPLFIGEPGVGKTALAEGIAQRIVNKQVPEHLHSAVIYSLDLGSLLAGTKFRGDFEGRLKNVVKELRDKPNSIIFIDEIHTIVGAGSTSGGSMDASNLLKPALADGSLSCIGSTTFTEYRQHFEKDRALSRRFQRIDVREPSINETIEILKGLKKYYETFHQVEYSEKALKAAAELSAKYISGRQLPDKAIDVIDEAGALTKIQHPGEKNYLVDEKMIETIISSIAQVPPQTVTLNDVQQLKNLDKKLKALVFGQDEAIDKLVAAIKMTRTGLGRDNKPIGSFLFSGPTGVGKTEVAKQLASLLGIPLVRFDMSEYMEKHSVARLVGAPPGYVGYEEGGLLTEAINKTPYCVLLLDEVEKAHPDLMSILLQVNDAGRLTDSNGRTSDFKNVIVVLTTNAGAHDVAKGEIGLVPSSRSEVSLEAIKKAFAPEFLNRLDAIVSFHDLSEEIILQIVDKLIHELSVQLLNKKIVLEISDPAKRWLMQKGYDKAYGARPMARAIDEYLKKPMADEILFGKLSQGGLVKVGFQGGRLKFEYKSESSKTTPETV